MKAKCMKFVDVGDGVSFICALDVGHDIKCAPRVEGRGACSERNEGGYHAMAANLR